ncbi:MAG: MoaD/ThiS family protein [Actinomycetes bacterium]
MATIRLFASARDAARTGRDTIEGSTVGEVLDDACMRYGRLFAEVVDRATIWCNGEPVGRDHHVGANDEVAVLPPISGGAA